MTRGTSGRLHDAESLRRELAARTGVRLLVRITANRRRMISVKRLQPDLFEVRLQELFLDAPPEVLDEIAGMVAGGGAGRRAIRAFVDMNFSESSLAFRSPARPPPSREASLGLNHDLDQYARELNTLYLGGRSTAQAVWGRRSGKRNIRSIRFACYDGGRNMIIMNRKLDSADIPRYFVEFVLFHEMLHEVLGIGERPDGRRDIHGAIFKLMEQTYPDYDKALRFEKELCARLFRR